VEPMLTYRLKWLLAGAEQAVQSLACLCRPQLAAIGSSAQGSLREQRLEHTLCAT
jgi:hypothetical protein